MKIRKLLGIILAAVMLAACASPESSSEPSELHEDSSAAVTAAPQVTLPRDNSVAENADTQAGSKVFTPAMWELTSDNGGKIVFMGSMHALKEECYPIPEAIRKAFDEADMIAVECDVSKTTEQYSLGIKQMQNMYYEEGDSIENHISAEVLKGLYGFCEALDYDISPYTGCKPWLFYSLLESIAMTKTDLKIDLGIELQLLQRAENTGKEIYELESAEYQLDMMLGFSDEILEAFMSSYTAENKDTIIKYLEDTYAAYIKGDVDYFAEQNDPAAMLKALSSTGAEPSEELVKEVSDYNEIMVYDRNIAQQAKLEELLKSGKKVFCVVGISHLCGERSILDIFSSKGYEVKQIQP